MRGVRVVLALTALNVAVSIGSLARPARASGGQEVIAP